MKLFEERDRYVGYNLTPDDVVFDVGCYEGNWSAQIFKDYGCRIHAFEPVPEFYNRCVRRFANNDRIRLWPFALGASNRSETFGVKGDMSGIFCDSPNEYLQVPVRDIDSVLENLMGEFDQVALLKLNCEGAEYEILERLLGLGLEKRFTHLQVQFHRVGRDFQRRHDLIREAIAVTHQLTYDEPFIWTGWSLRR